MSPWRMMNEWGIPTVELESLAYQYASKLAAKGEYVPDMVMAGGLTLEDHMYKAMALGAPFVKAVGMARAPIAAVMVGKTVETMIKEGKVTGHIQKYGKTFEEIFVETAELKHIYGNDFSKIPGSAVALYSYYQRLSQGLKQFMCGNRKFALEFIDRSDLISLTREAADVSGIKYVMDCDKEEAEAILNAPALNFI